MAKKKKETELCSIDEEMLMWTSYRYCIGRKTYVTSLAYYIAQKYYDKLSDERLEFTAEDIRDCIADILSFHRCCTLRYDGTVSRNRRYPLEDLLTAMSENGIDSQEKAIAVKEISVYCENYSDDAPKKFGIITGEENVRDYFDQSDIDELIPWACLASYFDKKNYVTVHTEMNGEKKDVLCYEGWTEDLLPIEGSKNTFRRWPMHWKKVYYAVDNGMHEYTGHIAEEYIIGVEKR